MRVIPGRAVRVTEREYQLTAVESLSADCRLLLLVLAGNSCHARPWRLSQRKEPPPPLVSIG
jgi:hypothetical protein